MTKRQNPKDDGYISYKIPKWQFRMQNISLIGITVMLLIARVQGLPVLVRGVLLAAWGIIVGVAYWRYGRSGPA